MISLKDAWWWGRAPRTPWPVFLTWRLRGRHLLLSPPERELVCDVLRHGNGHRYDLRAYVVMDDHVHVIVTTRTIPLDRLVHSWKSFSAYQLQRLHRRLGPIWMEGWADWPLKNENELRRKLEYVAANPWKRWPFLKRYPWAWEAEDKGAEEETAALAEGRGKDARREPNGPTRTSG